ncbi:putative methyltransferase NSUN6 isoform X2 [Denticeps clupeoides]|uniref:SAM-dependent MTase RsmB/NOP-type domain-containing protein n=1 Tax=Denticeps clupeoides TaxID=299321 RepID=A0AAY4ADM4_9TELE|nr:putative methyltransferase NSUN6 isoform X2 [Denticeps clupeoides]
MAALPQISMKPEVHEYLRNVFMNKELLMEVEECEAERRFLALLSCLSRPPSFTCVRVSTHLAPRHEVQQRLQQYLLQQSECSYPGGVSAFPLAHPLLADVLLLPVVGPRPVCVLDSEVIVGAQCGNAVLRGAHVFSPGILSTPKFLKTGDAVSVFSDVEGKCTKGAKEFKGKKVFLGNGVSRVDRAQIFCTDGPVRGLGIQMTEPVYSSPSFDGILPEFVFLQNLPSVLVSHVLGPKPGERILDMCAAPGGKTTHIAALIGNKGEVVALDKISWKVDKIRALAQTLKLDCIRPFCFNSIRAVSSQADNTADGPPFLQESFDRVLLDAPCSGLGQRPNMAVTWSLKEICSYQPLQRKLLHTAVQLLKRGGVLVYSTCTVTLAENEEQVAWALRTFPCLSLQAQEPHLGAEGMLGAGLAYDQRLLLQRFHPEPALSGVADRDTIGFFIAKFTKT